MEEALDERDVVGIVTPLFHVAALNIMFQPAVMEGATCTFLTKWGTEDFARMVKETGMTAAFMVPTQVSMVVSDNAVDPAQYDSERSITFDGAPMPDWGPEKMMQPLPSVAMTT